MKKIENYSEIEYVPNTWEISYNWEIDSYIVEDESSIGKYISDVPVGWNPEYNNYECDWESYYHTALEHNKQKYSNYVYTNNILREQLEELGIISKGFGEYNTPENTENNSTPIATDIFSEVDPSTNAYRQQLLTEIGENNFRMEEYERSIELLQRKLVDSENALNIVNDFFTEVNLKSAEDSINEKKVLDTSMDAMVERSNAILKDISEKIAQDYVIKPRSKGILSTGLETRLSAISTTSSEEYENLVRQIRTTNENDVLLERSSPNLVFNSRSVSLLTDDLNYPPTSENLTINEKKQTTDKKGYSGKDEIERSFWAPKRSKVYITSRVEEGQNPPPLPSWFEISPRPSDPNKIKDWEAEVASKKRWISKSTTIIEQDENPELQSYMSNVMIKENNIEQKEEIQESDDSYIGVSKLFEPNEIDISKDNSNVDSSISNLLKNK